MFFTPEIVTQKQQKLLLKNVRNCYLKTPEIVTQNTRELLLKNNRNCYSKTPDLVTQLEHRVTISGVFE
jgi:hypothetical protein